MMGIIADYGSDSGSDDDEQTNTEAAESISSANSGILSGLPAGQAIKPKIGRHLVTDDKLEDIVKPREWELKEAQKPPGKTRKSGKVRIAAFGSLLPKCNNDDGDEESASDDDEEEAADRSAAVVDPGGGKNGSLSSKSTLLGMLPQPKSRSDQKLSLGSKAANKAPMMLLPDSVRKNAARKSADARSTTATTTKGPGNSSGLVPQNVKKSANKKPRMDSEEGADHDRIGHDWGDNDEVELDGDDDDIDSKMEEMDEQERSAGGIGDFFGLTSKHDTIADVPVRAVGLNAEFGPAKPSKEDLSQRHPSQAYNFAGMNDQPGSSGEGSSDGRYITDDAARELIRRREQNPWDAGHFGGSVPSADDIIDVNVDRSLGPDVRANLLRNLGAKPSQAGPVELTTLQKPQGKHETTAKRKHQITYLAQVAKDREEQLQEMWARNRQNKRLGSQKYGF